MTPFRQRRPNFWIPQRKPGPPHRVEFDPQGRLSFGLKSLLLFDNCTPVSNVTGNNYTMGMLDYCNPQMSGNFVSNANLCTVTQCPFGGLAFKSPGSGAPDWLIYPQVPGPSTTDWSVSFLSKFDGLGVSTYTGTGLVCFQDAAGSGGIGVSATSPNKNKFVDFGGAPLTTPLVTSLLGWTRLTFTQSDSTIVSVYVNGVLSSSGSLNNIPVQIGYIIVGWPWPMADFFYWTTTLTASQVAQHYADPYGTTMRPRWAPLGTVGTTANVGRRPSLLNLGVGP